MLKIHLPPPSTGNPDVSSVLNKPRTALMLGQGAQGSIWILFEDYRKTKPYPVPAHRKSRQWTFQNCCWSAGAYFIGQETCSLPLCSLTSTLLVWNQGTHRLQSGCCLPLAPTVATHQAEAYCFYWGDKSLVWRVLSTVSFMGTWRKSKKHPECKKQYHFHSYSDSWPCSMNSEDKPLSKWGISSKLFMSFFPV